MKPIHLRSRDFSLLALVAWFLPLTTSAARANADASVNVAVGPQYDSTHVYLRAADLDSFAKSFVATLGGRASARTASTVTRTSTMPT